MRFKDLIKSLLISTPVYLPLRRAKLRARRKITVDQWEKEGRPMPPPHEIKQDVLRNYARKHGVKVLVETGTYLGDMVEALEGEFEKIYSIELSPQLHKFAKKRFSRSPKVNLILGDSGHEIDKLLRQLNQPAIFWLDAHYSAGLTARAGHDTPVIQELGLILKSSDKHLILIDDARCFGTDPAYPDMVYLRSFVNSLRPGAEISVDTDSIRILPVDT